MITCFSALVSDTQGWDYHRKPFMNTGISMVGPTLSFITDGRAVGISLQPSGNWAAIFPSVKDDFFQMHQVPPVSDKNWKIHLFPWW
jgi:hypothetical protein